MTFKYEPAETGKRIRKLMAEANENQSELARFLGMSRAAVSLYVNGTTMPSIQTAGRIAEHYGVDVDYLISGAKMTGAKEKLAKPVDGAGLADDMRFLLNCSDKFLELYRLAEELPEEKLDILISMVKAMN